MNYERVWGSGRGLFAVSTIMLIQNTTVITRGSRWSIQYSYSNHRFS